MKKSIAVLLVALFSICAWSQKEDYQGMFRVVPRFDAGANFYKGEKPEMDWGNSGLYTEFEQNITSAFKFHMLNLWVNSTPKDLYSNFFCPSAANFLPVLTLEINFSNFYVSLGKDYSGMGGFENDPSDYDFDFDQLSPFCSNMVWTQWGGRIGWVSNSENTDISLAVTSSPFGTRTFADGLLSFTGIWRGNYGPFSNIWGLSAIATQKGKYQFLATLGQRLTFGSFSATFDWFNTSNPDPSESNVLPKGHTLRGELAYNFGGRGDISFTGIRLLDPTMGNSWIAGMKIHILPVRNLKVSLTGAYNTAFSCWDFRAGLLYYLDFSW